MKLSSKTSRNINLYKLFSSKKLTLIFSFVIAIVAWFITVGVYDTNASRDIKDVPITVNDSNFQTQQLGLVASNINPASVRVTVSGPRYKISELGKDDISVHPTTIADVTSADSYNLKLTAELKNPQSDVSISSISSNTASFDFDTVSTKTLNLTAEAPNVKVDDGYILQPAVTQPETITVEGPQQSISQLSEIKLICNDQLSLNNTKVLDADPHFISGDGTEMDSSVFKYNKDINFKITIPVFKQKQTPITFKYKNAPPGFDTSKLKYTISPSTVNLAGSADAIDNISEISLGYIDIRQLDSGKSFTFSIPIPSGFKNMDTTDTATVTFDDSDWSSKTFSVTDIQTTNIPPEYNVKILTTVIKNIKIVGISDEINNLTAADVTATIDFTNQTLQEGKQSVPVTIGILSKSGVWAAGDYSCIVTADKK